MAPKRPLAPLVVRCERKGCEQRGIELYSISFLSQREQRTRERVATRTYSSKLVDDIIACWQKRGGRVIDERQAIA